MAGSTSLRRSSWVFFGFVATLFVALILLALANREQQQPGRSPSVWYTATGVDWIHIPLDWDGDQRLVAVAAAEDRLVAVGSGKSGGTAWTSEDGLSWRLSWSSEEFDPADVVAGDSGWFAVGGSWDGAIFASADGVNWHRVLSEPAAALRTAGNLGATLVAGGGTWSQGNEVAATVWVATDTEEWARIVLPDGAGSQVVGFAPFGSGLLAAGDLGAIWFSPDGRAWEAWETTGFEPLSVNDIAATDQLMAIGWNGRETPGIWMSTDGRAWHEVAPPEEWDPHSLVEDGAETLALGRIGDCQTSVLAVTAAGELTDRSGSDPVWLSNECRDGIPHTDDECEESSARAYDAVRLSDDSVVVVGHW